MIDLSAGQLVADKYRVDHVIGSGGMGVVLAATHLDLDQPVAIKVLRDASDEAIARFQREARLIVRLKSVHVARVFDVGVLDDDTPFFVMERLEGEDLSKLLAARGPLPVEQAVDYVLEAGEAIAEAHTLGMVHRDLKPANLFVARGPGGKGSVKVLDFGISKSTAEGSQVGHLTNEGVALGSPGYMAPEQIESSRDVDARADIYSLGAILYRLTSGVSPYKGDSLISVLAAMASGPLQPLTAVADVPPEFARIVERCLAQEPAARPASIADLARALAPFGSRRAHASTEQILATMGLEDVGVETVTLTQKSSPSGVASIAPLGETLRVELAAPMPAPRPRATSSSSLLPLGLAMVFLLLIVGWVAFLRAPPPPPATAAEPASSAAPPPLILLPAAQTTEATAIDTAAPPRASTRRHPRPAPPPVLAPKKPTDSPPSLSDIPGGRH